MGKINFNKPAKVRSTAEHNKRYMSDSGVDGTYVPNMSREAMYEWKGKHIKGKDERIEIRKTFYGTQMLIVVYKNRLDKEGYGGAMITQHENIQISMNSKLHLTWEDYKEFKEVIQEAELILNG